MPAPHHRAQDHVEEVRVSEGTRKMSRPAGYEVMTTLQEYDRLVEDKQRIEFQLTAFNKTAMLKEQARIRKQRGDTLAVWIARKAEMQEQKNRLLAQLQAIQSRMTSIRDKAAEERRMLYATTDPRDRLLQEILNELREIRKLLAEKSS